MKRIKAALVRLKQAIAVVRVYKRIAFLESRSFPTGTCEGCGGLFDVRHGSVSYHADRETIRCGLCEIAYQDRLAAQARRTAKKSRRAVRSHVAGTAEGTH